MLTYEAALAALKEHQDEGYRAFHRKLLKDDSIDVIGVRMPVLRALAKRWKGEWECVRAFPDEYYEVTFLKCAVAAQLPYEQLVSVLDGLVGLLDNWATCDGFAPACIAKRRAEFVPYIEKYLADGRVFVRRFALTTLLHFYVDGEGLPFVLECLKKVRAEEYYVSMAAAWLAAEVLVKFPSAGEKLLTERALDPVTHDRAIRKACESFRVTPQRKEVLRALRCGCHKK